MIKTDRLSTGVRLVTEDIPYVKSAAIGFWVKAGAVDESAAISGISHFIEHMMFKGTNNRSAKKIAEDVDMIGGQINAFTGKEATCYYIKTLSENLEDAIEILGDIMQNSLFEEKEINRESGVIIEEMKMIEDSPDELAHDLLVENIFKEHPLGRSIIGTRDSVSAMKREDFQKYITDHYTTDNIIISVAGNFDRDRLKSKIEKVFLNLGKNDLQRELAPSIYSPSYISKTKEIEQTHICIGKKGIKLEDDNYYSMSVLNSILGGGMSSRLFQNIREQQGLAYSVYSMTSSFVDDGYFMIYAGVAEDKAEVALKGISDELKKLKKNGITENELNLAKQQIKGSYIFSLENTASRMFAIGKNEMLLNKVYSPEEVISEIDAVDENSTNAMTDLVADINEYSAVIIGKNEYDSKKMIREA